MYKVINGKEVLCCDICGDPVSLSDIDACIGTVQYISRPAADGVSFCICGECHSIYEIEVAYYVAKKAKEEAESNVQD